MRQIVFCCAILISSVFLFAQQEQPPPATTPPYKTPPTFPEGQTPRSQTPDTQAPPSQKRSDRAVEGKILDQLRAEPALSRTSVDARVDQNSVVLSGKVANMAQHDLAVRIAQQNAGTRNVVDKIKVKQQT